MKRIITAILPLILIAQIPFSPTDYVPDEWMKNVQYGLKWTELMMNGYPGAAEETEMVPEGEVTTTVVMAGAILDPVRVQILRKEICNEHLKEIVSVKREVLKVHLELKEHRLIRIHAPQVL